MQRYAWVIVGAFLIYCYSAAAYLSDVAQIPAQVETPLFRIELTDVYPICDHFPSAPRQPVGPHTYLMAKLKFTNLTDHLLQFEIIQTAISFDKGEEGELVKGISVQNEQGVATGQMKITVPSGEQIVNLRGDSVFGKDLDGRKLYLTLTLSSPQGKVILRNTDTVARVD